MNEKKVILEFVMGLRIDNHRRSNLSLSLQNARRCCGYQQGVSFTRKEFDLRCQGKSTDDEADMFCALLNYLVVLEQIGTLFYKGRIIEALKESGLSQEQKCALNALRNSFAHHGGLAIWNESNGKGYKFVIDFNDNTDVVKVASRKWGGDYTDKSEETSTVIYAIPFIRLVEDIVARLQENIDLMVSQCTMTAEGIKSKFTILT
jgi:hypothetical protein